jgi:hypothetical protein
MEQEVPLAAVPASLRHLIEASLPLISGGRATWGLAQRREIYAAMGQQHDPQARRPRSWLGVLAGKKVLPVYLAAVAAVIPPEEIPAVIAHQMRYEDWMRPFEPAVLEYVAGVQRSDPFIAAAVAAAYAGTRALLRDGREHDLRLGLIDLCGLVPFCLVLAEMVGRGALPPEAAVCSHLSELCYHAFGNIFGCGTIAADLAQDTAKDALDEARGYVDPSERASGHVADTFYTLGEWIYEGDSASGCTACGAMTAEDTIDYVRLQAMWRWWLLEAAPRAWVYGHFT